MTHRDTRSPRGWHAARMFCAGLAGTLLVAGCGAADESTSSADGGGAATSSSYFSPLQEYLSPSSTGAGADEANQAKEKKAQEIAAACMADQGFDYVPFVYPMSSTMVLDDTDYSSRAWAEKYGYGISTVDAFGTSSTAESVNDPNQAIVDAMSEGEREAYYQALYGGGMMVASSSAEAEAMPEAASTDSTAPETSAEAAASTDAVESTDDVAVSIPEQSVEAGASMVSMADQGCMGQAQAEVYGDPTSGDQTQFQPMWDAYNAMYSEIETDARVTAAKDAWIGCMADAGHPGYTDVWGANQEANDKWGELNGWNMSEAGGGVATTSSSVAATSSTGPAPDKVAAFKDYEIALALVDFDCKASSDYATVSDTVRIELEQKFLEEHRAELEQYRDVVNGGG